jgi:hypothetical protein
MRKNDGEPKDSSDAPNEFIAKKLDELHDTYEAIEGKNSFSVVAYRKGTRFVLSEAGADKHGSCWYHETQVVTKTYIT